MPSRILRDGILTSERVNSLNWEAEVFYRRLMSVVDDFGRFTAHPALLRAALYPLKLDAVRDANMERLLASVEQARLVRVYEVAGKRYLELLDFRQQVRARASKYPPPPDAEHVHSTCTADAEHVPHTGAASAPVFGDEDEDEDEDVNEGGDGENPRGRARKRRRAASPPPVSVSPEALIEAGFTPELAAEFIAEKARRKAPLTKRAWDDHCREAQKAGWTAVQAAEKVLAKAWKGFEAAYVAGDRRPNGNVNGCASEPAWRTEQRERWVAYLGPAASPQARAAVAAAAAASTPIRDTIDLEAPDAPATKLG